MQTGTHPSPSFPCRREPIPFRRSRADGNPPHPVVPVQTGTHPPSVVPAKAGTHPIPSFPRRRELIPLPSFPRRREPIPFRHSPRRACPVLDTGTEVRVLLSRGFRGILFQTVPQQPHLVAEGPDFGTRPGAPAKHIRIEARRIRTEMRLAHGGCERGVHIARIARAFAPVNDRPSFRRSRADGNPPLSVVPVQTGTHSPPPRRCRSIGRCRSPRPGSRSRRPGREWRRTSSSRRSSCSRRG